MKSTSFLLRTAAIAGMTLTTPSASAQYINIFGGPSYTPGVGGYQNPSLAYAPGLTVNDAGTAIGYAVKYNGASVSNGNRAVRWDGSGAVATELGNLGTDTSGFTETRGYAINSAGIAIGSARKYDGTGVSKGFRAVRWDALGTTVTELGNLGTSTSGVVASCEAFAINTSGTTIGYATKYDGAGVAKGERAVRWDASGTAATELGNLGTNTSGSIGSCQAYAINTAGTAIGYAQKYDGAGVSKGYRAVRWNPLGTVATELGTLGTDANGVTSSSAFTLNNAGTIIGNADKYDGAGVHKGFRAVRWDASSSTATELGLLGTDTSGVTGSLSYAINDAGTAVGSADKYDGAGVFKGHRAVRWDASGTAATELGNLGTSTSGSTTSFAFAINATGIAVGYTNQYNGSGSLLGQRAVYWGFDGVAVNLNAFVNPASGWTNLSEVHEISDTGWITGYGSFDPDGAGGQVAYNRMFLLQVPEPSSLALLSLGGVAMLRRHNRRSRRM